MPIDFGDFDSRLDAFDASDFRTPDVRGGAIWLTGMADVLRAAGLTVIEYPGWQNRARSSGGYTNGRPYCVMEHHTASNPSSDGQGDADYIAEGADAAPICNVYIQRNGTCWVIAAGATNTNGTGQAMQFSRGYVAADQMNISAVGIEVANNGVGEPYPEVQINSLITAANAINRRIGNQPTDIAGHSHYAVGRKIDPATASAVLGPWQPRSDNSSGSWNLDDMRAEHQRRWTGVPDTPMGGEPMRILLINDAGGAAVLLSGHIGTWLDPGRYEAFMNAYRITPEAADTSWLANVVMTGALPPGVTNVWDTLD